MHDRQMPGALGAVLEGDADALVRRVARQRLPKGQQPREIIFERLIKRISAALIHFQFDDRARKTGHGADTNMRGHLDGTTKNSGGKFRLFGIERVFIKSADGGNAQAA